MVAVRMVSEGVDIPRLAVGVYATSISTALFFAQAVGRFVRARRRGETASVFVPSVPILLGFAAELEAERDHVLHPPSDAPEEDELAQAQRQRDTPDDLLAPSIEVLKASAHFDRVLYDGGEFGTATAPGSAEEEDFLGLPGLLEPSQVAHLLRQRQADQLRTRSAGPVNPASSVRPGLPVHARTRRTSAGRCRAPGQPGGARRPAQGAERPGRSLEPPHRPAPRCHPQRPAPGLRRPAAAPGHGRADPGPHRHDPRVGHPPLAVGVPRARS